MAATHSTMAGLGTPAPDFAVPDVISGDTIALETFAGKRALLVMFICPHCPFVVHVQGELGRLAKHYADESVGIVAISSNDVAQAPADSPEGMRKQAAAQHFPFPYCYDESQSVAHAYQAACTPDFF